MSPKPIIRPLVLFLAAIATVAVWPLHAAVVLREEFNYPDGPIHETSGGAWTPQPGGAPAIAIENHAALPGGAGTGYVTRKFSAKPAGGRATATLLVRFDGPVQPGKGRQVLFQFTDESGKKRRGRLFMRGGPDGDTVQLGVTSKNASDAVWGARALPLAEEHTLVFHYNSAGGATRLWINPTAATTRPDAEAVDADALAPGRASLQVDSRWNLGRVLISGIVVHDDPPGGGGAAPESSSGAAAPKTSAAPESSSSAAAATAAPSASKPAARSASAAPPPRPKVPAVTPPPARRFYVFLLAGQSNMAGRGPVGEIDRAPDPRILAFDGPGRWIPAAEPLHNDKRGTGVGPGLAFARALLPHLPPDASIGLIPAAFGGTSMAQWQKDYKGDFRWPDGRTLFQLATESAT
ncbi:MAG: sialate O-acetylesterase, partial [Opitutaceae bacterium]|nr:sialate O-acetylesterase [Opitutaceae bacterium]